MKIPTRFILLTTMTAFWCNACNKGSSVRNAHSYQPEGPGQGDETEVPNKRDETEDPDQRAVLSYADKLMKRAWRSSGDSLFGCIHAKHPKSYDYYVQAKRATLVAIRSATLNEADALNGLEWSGVVEYTLAPIREYNHNDDDKKWTEWQQEGRKFLLQFEKRNGIWRGGVLGWGVGDDSRYDAMDEIDIQAIKID